MNQGTEQFGEPIEQTRKAYQPPRLTDYGSLADLTRGGSFVGNDGNTKCTGNAGPIPDCGGATS